MLWLRKLLLMKQWRVRFVFPRRLRPCSRNCRSCRTRAIALVLLLNAVFIISLYRGGSGSARFPAGASSPTAAGALPTVAVTGTPLLDQLDRFRVHRDLGTFEPAELDRCEVWTAGVPDVGMEEPQRWQIVNVGERDTFVFSAFFDARSVVKTTWHIILV